jgi:hypothetical protein
LGVPKTGNFRDDFIGFIADDKHVAIFVSDSLGLHPDKHGTKKRIFVVEG